MPPVVSAAVHDVLADLAQRRRLRGRRAARARDDRRLALDDRRHQRLGHRGALPGRRRRVRGVDLDRDERRRRPGRRRALHGDPRRPGTPPATTHGRSFPITVDTTAPSIAARTSASIFSPNGDGTADTTTLSWTGNEPATGTARLYRGTTLVRSWTVTNTSAWHVAWNGRTAAGAARRGREVHLPGRRQGRGRQPAYGQHPGRGRPDGRLPRLEPALLPPGRRRAPAHVDGLVAADSDRDRDARRVRRVRRPRPTRVRRAAAWRPAPAPGPGTGSAPTGRWCRRAGTPRA